MKLVLPNPTTFVGWGLEPGLILYTSHLLASFNLGRTPVKFNGRKSIEAECCLDPENRKTNM